MIFLLLSCGSHNIDDTADPCLNYHYNNFGRAFVQQYCSSCHAQSAAHRQGAPIDIHMQSSDNISEYQQQIFTAIENSSMPPQGGVDENNRSAALAWLQCMENR
jgi:uncharacterized membrane protein